MSAQSSGRFSIIPAHAVFDTRLAPAAYRVLGAFGTYSDEDGWCWPSLATIGRRIGTSKQAVAKQVSILVELGYLEVHARTRPDGSRTSNKYRVVYDGEPFDEGRQPDVDPRQPHVDGRQPPEVDAILERPNERLPLEAANAPSREAPALPLALGEPEPTKRGTRLNVETLPPGWRKFCEAERPDLDPERVFAMFCDHWRAAPGQKGVKRDWSATWRNWIRRQGQFDGQTSRKTQPGDPEQDARLREGLAAGYAAGLAS